MSQTDDYKALPTKVSKQIIRRLDLAWLSYFADLKSWKQHREKFLGKPKIPQYKDKIKGRNINLQKSLKKRNLSPISKRNK